MGGTIVSCLVVTFIFGVEKRYPQFFSTHQNHSKRMLQNYEYSNKLSKYTLKALKSSLNVLKSSQKLLIALKKYAASLLYTMYLGLFRSVSQLILMP